MPSSNTKTTLPTSGKTCGSGSSGNSNKLRQTRRNLLPRPRNQHLRTQESTGLGGNYITKSKAAAVWWSGSEKKIAKARQQALSEARREKAALLGLVLT
ncbi:hypothetical protein L209DRAFT_757545 [Thermothelomyces heterothallicus CBS 203.75]